MRRIAAACLALAFAATPAAAEDVIAVLSSHRVAIDSSFDGTTITLFGAIERDAGTVARPKGYDVVVVVRGPEQWVTTRRKERRLGVWVNRHAQSFAEVPSYYAVLSSEPLSEITAEEVRRKLQLGIDEIALPTEAGDPDPDFEDAFRRLKRDASLYVEAPDSITMLTSTLFKADIPIPANVPTGVLSVDVLIFADGALLRMRSLDLEIAKTGFEQTVFVASTQTPFLYGLLTAALALLSGWVASVMFRRE